MRVYREQSEYSSTYYRKNKEKLSIKQRERTYSITEATLMSMLDEQNGMAKDSVERLGNAIRYLEKTNG